MELGDGVFATCPITAEANAVHDAGSDAKADISSLGSMLKARWKGNTGGATPKAEAARAGQIRSFRITRLDLESKKIELQMA